MGDAPVFENAAFFPENYDFPEKVLFHKSVNKNSIDRKSSVNT